MFPELITNCLLQDLTIEQFQEKTARSLESVPGVRISKSYASIRRQGEGGAGARPLPWRHRGGPGTLGSRVGRLPAPSRAHA